MNTTDLIGYAASAIVVATFCMRQMVSLRLLAMLGNLVFIVYAFQAGVMPVLLMNAVLLPLNAWRLLQVRRGGGESATVPAPAPARDPLRRQRHTDAQAKPLLTRVY
jgi:hypothetical protein